MLHAVIMAGGAGTRFWPLSRVQEPKQLLKLAGESTMLQATFARLDGLVSPQRTLVLTNEQLVAATRQQLPQLPADAVVGEPAKRDTAPCIALAAMLVLRRDAEATMLVIPSDHVIEPASAFQAGIRQAEALVEADPRQLAAFGIRATYPAECYGYIAPAEPIDSSPYPAFRVSRFREKPQAEAAREFIAAGYFWNAGIFVWKARTILEALAEYEPAMFSHLEKIQNSLGKPNYRATLETEFCALSGKSIDFAVLEKHPHKIMVEAPFQWDDVGNWQSLSRLHGEDDQGNTIIGKHLGIDTSGCIVRGDGEHLIATVGLKNCIIVHTPTATLVAQKDDEEGMRRVTAKLKELGWEKYL